MHPKGGDGIGFLPSTDYQHESLGNLGSPKLRMVSWNLNTLRFGGDYIPQSSSDVR